MKLRTSFFNGTVLKKDITRFAPIWGLYTIFMFMAFFLLWEAEIDAARFANTASYILRAMGVVNFCYAGICALLLFGDLFTSRMCNALHAFPMRREGWFLTHCVAGLLFSLVPNVLAAALAGLLLQEYFFYALLWLGLMCLQYLFFFGVAVFAVMCAGNRLGATAVYGIFNFLAVIVAWLVVTFYEPFLYGISLNMEQFMNYSPVVGFSSFEYISTQYDKMTAATKLLEIYWDHWRFAIISGGVGLVLLGLSVLLYRKRQLESAGSFIAFRPVSPVFLVIYTLCAGATMYYAAELFETGAQYVFLVLGFAIGFFTGFMLLERKVNVFQGKRLLKFGLLLALFGISVGLTWLDPVGMTRYVPEIADVQQVKIRPNVATYYWETTGFGLTEEADIQAITDVHKRILTDRPEDGDMWVTITYELKNGNHVERQYLLNANSEPGQVLKGYYSSWEYVLGIDAETLLENFRTAEFHSNDPTAPYIIISKENTGVDESDLQEKFGYWEGGYVGFVAEDFDEAIMEGLLEAIQKDCQSGAMAQAWAYHEGHEAAGWLMIEMDAVNDVTSQDLIIAETSSAYTNGITYSYDFTTTKDMRICQDCTHTIEFLKNLTQP